MSTSFAVVVLLCFAVVFMKMMKMPGGARGILLNETIETGTEPEESGGDDASVDDFAPYEGTDANSADSLRQAKKEAEDSVLLRLRSYMEEEGVSTVEVLRTFFPNQLVVYNGGRYYFEDISRSIPKNPYQDCYFTENADGTWNYEDENGVIGHPGIDVSRFQGQIDWDTVGSQNIEFAILRLGYRGYSEGAIVPDETFEDNIQGALDAKLHVGVYFLTQATTMEEIDEEVTYVLEMLEPYEIDGPIVLDVENVADGEGRTAALSKEERTALIQHFFDEVKKADFKPMLYTNLKSLVLLMNYEDLADIPLWYAFYSRPIYFPYDYDILQYSETGHIEGIPEKVDLNLCMKPWWEE